jgi:hypothetical protein
MHSHQRPSVRPELEALETRALPATLLDVATAITHSYEAQSNEVTAYYTNLLQRSPSSAEVLGWVQQLNQGVTYEVVQASFVSSPEFLGKHGGEGPAWVQSLYQDLLGRTPGQAELNNWTAQIAAGASPQAIASAFAGGVEHLSDRVIYDYQHFLGRTPGTAEVNGWVHNILAGTHDQDVEAGFVASSEFFDGISHSDQQQWIINAYQTVLGRTPGTSEVNAWLNALAASHFDSSPNSPTGNVDNSGSNSNVDSGSGNVDNSGSGSVDNSGSGSVDNSGSGSVDNSGSGSVDNSGSSSDCGCGSTDSGSVDTSF